ncbi:hypothetical protein L1987_70697 [Smallanthus sonchifolius]|uniref:Uncharacterized protein n=1 Tax=Smallanthus sonchifolius TaxID=185202 RepID=A0ACB9AR11_9ASTR|nr:hypothetical protein L1987_70697 [Smallanthus sonchifolius]
MIVCIDPYYCASHSVHLLRCVTILRGMVPAKVIREGTRLLPGKLLVMAAVGGDASVTVVGDVRRTGEVVVVVGGDDVIHHSCGGVWRP